MGSRGCKVLTRKDHDISFDIIKSGKSVQEIIVLPDAADISEPDTCSDDQTFTIFDKTNGELECMMTKKVIMAC